MADGPVRVMVVDDHAVVRAALAALVGAASGMEVCAQAATVGEAEALAQTSEPDVVIVDLHLSDGTGISASRRIRNRRPATRVVLLTAASDQDALYASILAGAAAYLPKQLRGTDLVGTIRAVSGGARLLDARLVADLVAGHGETRLLSLLAEGRTDRDVQRVLGVDETTLAARVDRLIEEMRPSRSERSLATATSEYGGARADGRATA
jgi:two-component system response regulator DevR